jgi:hypothetical protein
MGLHSTAYPPPHHEGTPNRWSRYAIVFWCPGTRHEDGIFDVLSHNMYIPAEHAEHHSGYKHTGPRPQPWRSCGRSTAHAQTVSPLVDRCPLHVYIGLATTTRQRDEERNEYHCLSWNWCWISVLSGTFSESIFDNFPRQISVVRFPIAESPNWQDDLMNTHGHHANHLGSVFTGGNIRCGHISTDRSVC